MFLELRDQFGVVILIQVAGVMVHFAVLDQHVSTAATNTDTGMGKLWLLVVKNHAGVPGELVVEEQHAMHAVMEVVGRGSMLFYILPTVIDFDGEVCKFCDKQFVIKP